MFRLPHGHCKFVALLIQVGQGHLGLAHTSVVIVVELVKVVFDHALLPSFVQVRSVVIERIKVLCHARHQGLEARVRLWTRPGDEK